MYIFPGSMLYGTIDSDLFVVIKKPYWVWLSSYHHLFHHLSKLIILFKWFFTSI